METIVKNYGTAFGELETPEIMSDAQVEARTRELLAQLTLDEKINMMCGDLPFWHSRSERDLNGSPVEQAVGCTTRHLGQRFDFLARNSRANPTGRQWAAGFVCSRERGLRGGTVLGFHQ